MGDPQDDLVIVVDVIAEGLPPTVTLERSGSARVGVASAQRWERPNGSVFALVTWDEWPIDGDPTP